jgi:hypothetical protein
LGVRVESGDRINASIFDVVGRDSFMEMKGGKRVLSAVGPVAMLLEDCN